MKKIYMIIRILTCKKVILISELSKNSYKVSFGGLYEIEATRVLRNIILTRNSMDKEFIKGQLKSALFWLNTSNTKKNILHAKDSINMAIKELED
ncbi:MAG: hypothetical protein ACLT4A_11625 [Anaerobutyricum soehngenii]